MGWTSHSLATSKLESSEASLCSSFFPFPFRQVGVARRHGDSGNKKLGAGGRGSIPFLPTPTPTPLPNFLLLPHAFAQLPLGSHFLPLRGNGICCYAGYSGACYPSSPRSQAACLSQKPRQAGQLR